MVFKEFFKLEKRYIPFKAHYFFFFGSTGCTMPFLIPYATQLGASPATVGIIYSILPFTVMMAKPLVGGLADKYQQQKVAAVLAIALMTFAMFSVYFIPEEAESTGDPFPVHSVLECYEKGADILSPSLCDVLSVKGWTSVPTACHLTCVTLANSTAQLKQLCHSTMCNGLLPNVPDTGSKKHSSTWKVSMNLTLIVGNVSNPSFCDSVTFESESMLNDSGAWTDARIPVSLIDISGSVTETPSCQLPVIFDCQVLTCNKQTAKKADNQSLANSSISEPLPESPIPSSSNVTNLVFFTMCMVLGWIGLGTATSLSDAIVLHTLGTESASLFGYQRLWGAIGWGLWSLVAGYIIDLASEAKYGRQSGLLYITPGLFGALILGACDLAVVSRIQMPHMKKSDTLIKDVLAIFRTTEMVAFTGSVFGVGVLTGALWTFLIVYLNDLGAKQLLIGLVMMVECFVGEVPFFFLSGWIVRMIGHAHAMTLVLATFAARFFFYSLLSNPWMVLPIEVTQGLCYSVFFTALATYSSSIAPDGTASTMQGILQGVFEGFGVGVGNLVAGILYEKYGGSFTFLILGIFAGVTCVLYCLAQLGLRNWPTSNQASTENKYPENNQHDPEENIQMLTISTQPDVACSITGVISHPAPVVQ